MISNFVRILRPVDVLIIVFTHILSLTSIIFCTRVSVPLIVINILVGISIVVVSRYHTSRRSNVVQKIYDWYPIPMIFFIFKEVHIIIQSLVRSDWDNSFIDIDRMIFGGDPTIWLSQYSTPLLTELLQISYASYYFIMLAVGTELYIKKEHQKFSFAVFAIVYGFVLSYIGYLLFPAVGPRFTLHDFYSMNIDLPGLWLTNTIRDLINAGESIPKGALNAISLAQRDVFPSGHTQMTLISMYFAYQYKLKCRYIIHIFGFLLIFSTVYLRYHYVIDLVGGILFMILTMWSAPKLIRWWERWKISTSNL